MSLNLNGLILSTKLVIFLCASVITVCNGAAYENVFCKFNTLVQYQHSCVHMTFGCKGVALKCSQYSDLRPRSRCTVKLKSALTFA